MIRKKLIALGLIGMTIVGVTVSNNTVATAAPKNFVSTGNVMKDIVIKGLDSLENLVNQGTYERAKSCRNRVDFELTSLSDTGEDVTDLQKKFDELSKKVEVLGDKQKKIDGLKEDIKDTIRGIMYALNNKEYEFIPDMFNDVSSSMEKLSKIEPVSKATIDSVKELKDKYDNREKTDKAEKIVSTIVKELDELSKKIKEKNIDESLAIRKQVDSEMKELAQLTNVPGFITSRFNYYSEKIDKLIADKNESEKLKGEINNLLNDVEEFIIVKDYNGANDAINKIYKYIGKLDKSEKLEEQMLNRLSDLRNRFEKMEKVAPAKPVIPVQPEASVNAVKPVVPVQPKAPVNAVKPVVPVQPKAPVNAVKPVVPVQPKAPVNAMKLVVPGQPFASVNIVDEKKSKENRNVEKVNDINLISKGNVIKEEVKVDNKSVEANKNNKQDIKNVNVEKANTVKKNEVANKVNARETKEEKAVEKQNQLPKTGSPVGTEGLFGLGAAISALGAMTLRRFKK